MRIPLVLIRSKNSRDDEMTCGHADSPGDKNRLAAQIVDPDDRWDGRDEHGYADNTGRKERGRVAAHSELLENGRRVV